MALSRASEVAMLLARGARVSPFNGRYAKIEPRRPPVNHSQISDPLNRLMAHGISDFESASLVERTALPSNHPLHLAA